MRVLRIERIRLLFLNAILLLVFASAWVSDRWPELTVPAIIFAAIIVVGEAILLYVAAKRGAPRDESTVLPAQELEELKTKQRGDWLVAFEDEFDDLALRRSWSTWRRFQYARFRHQHMLYELRPRASRASTWALAALYDDDRSLARELELRFARELEHRRPHPELAKWKLVTHSEQAFNIVAGAFEIEYFHGRINIRVIDSTHVTVEGKSRGARSKVAPPDIRPARYQ